MDYSSTIKNLAYNSILGNGSSSLSVTPTSGASASTTGSAGAVNAPRPYVAPINVSSSASNNTQTTPVSQPTSNGGGSNNNSNPYSGFQPTDEWARTHTGMSLADFYKAHPEYANQGPSQDEINKAINDIYDSSNNYLNQAESQVRSDYPTVQSDINNQFTTSQGQLDTTHNNALQQFGTQADQAAYQNQNALAQSRNLYNELRQGYQQRFGGSTSAGDAANQVASVAQQQQEGQTNRSYNDTTTAINNNRANTDAQYTQNIQALQTQRDAALNQANRDFQNKLLSISQNRAATAQAKAQANLQALQDLRNQVFSINQQNTQFQQTLEAMRQQSALQLQNYQALAGNGVNAGSQALGVFQNQPQATNNGLVVGGYQAPQQTQQLQGAISSGGHFDPNTGQWVNS